MTNTYIEPKPTVAICVRVSPATREQLKELAEHWVLPMTAVIEKLIIEANKDQVPGKDS